MGEIDVSARARSSLAESAAPKEEDTSCAPAATARSRTQSPHATDVEGRGIPMRDRVFKCDALAVEKVNRPWIFRPKFGMS